MDDNKDNLDTPFDPEKESGLDETLNDRRIVRIVRSFMRMSKDYREDFLDLADHCRRLYKNWEIESRSKIKRANLQPSYGFMIIETLLPQLNDIFFGDNRVVKFRGREAEDMLYEDTLTDFIDIQFEDMELHPKTVSFFKNLLLDGTAIAKVPYRFEEQLIKTRQTQVDPETGASFTQKMLALETMYDGPDLQIVPIYDFFPDWRVKEPGAIHKMRGVAHRMYRSFSELKALERKVVDGQPRGVYKNLDELKMSKKTKGAGSAWGGCYWEDEHKKSFEDQDNNKQGIKDSDQIELWEFWGLVDLDGSGELVEAVVTIANGDVVIRAEENFYDYKHKPFVACVNYVRPNEFYGIPELAAVDAEIREAKAIRNARLDQINLGVNTMWLVDRASGIDAKNLYSRPGGIIFSNDIDGIKPIQIGDPSGSSSQELGLIESNISQTTAIGSPPVVGSAKSFARSATGVNFVQQFASSRIGLKAALISNLYFKRLVNIVMCTNMQFVTDEQWVRASDPSAENPFNKLPPNAFFRNYDFIIKTKPDEPDQVRFEKMQAVSQILQAAEQTQPGVVKMDVVLEALLRPILGSGVKKFMRTEEELRQRNMENAALRVQEQAANAQIGQLAPQPNALPGGQSGPI